MYAMVDGRTWHLEIQVQHIIQYLGIELSVYRLCGCYDSHIGMYHSLAKLSSDATGLHCSSIAPELTAV